MSDMDKQVKQEQPVQEPATPPKPDEAQVPGGKDKKPKKEKKKKTVGQEILSWVLTLVAAVVIAGLVRALLIEPVRVQGGSMDTTLVNGEVMLVTKPEVLLGRLERGDVIICRYPEVGPITGDMIVGHPKLVVLPLNRIRTIR